MNKRLEIIDNCSLFKGLPREHLEELSRIGEEKHYQKGKIIFYEGHEGSGFYVVAEGRVKIYKVSLVGKEQILHIFGPGEPFGEVPVFSGSAFPANAPQDAMRDSRFSRRRSARESCRFEA